MNNLIKQLQSAKRQGYLDGLRDGKETEKAVMMIALNEVYQFGGDRLAKVESEEKRIWKDEIYGNLDTGARHIEQRLNQIKGVWCGDKEE